MATIAALPIPRFQTASVPIVGMADSFPVRRVYCVGRNYLEHIREMKESDERDPPFFFQKPTDAVVVDGVVPYPMHTTDFQYEVELVVAVGLAATEVSVSEAHGVVFGYAVGLDMTRRDRQREAAKNGLAWEIGKSFDFSAPCGHIHSAAEVGHIGAGSIELRVDNQVRQKSMLEKMIWNVPEIISHLSYQYTLMPGDLIFTGTPAGVGPVMPGNTLVAEIEGLTPLTVQITESALHSRRD